MSVIPEEEHKIMVVDDNPANVKVLEKILKYNGYSNIRSITDSRKVLEQYIEYRPDLMLLDLMMPHMDGFEILEKLKCVEEGYLPVIVVTAQNGREDRLKALELGAQDFIGKPLDSSEVLTRIRNFLKIRSKQNQMHDYNLWLEDKVRQETGEYYQLEMEVVDKLVRAAECRDYNTGSHIDRIEDYACTLCQALGLEAEQSRILSFACKMHDIGKIGIPDEILLKPGKLSSQEWEIMKQHSQKGAELLKGSSSKIILMAEEIARTHHEKWDGTGYPNGLQEEEIPFSGRIMALIDVFDALLSERPYKEAWDFDQTILYILSESGKHFDPAVVEAFTKSIKEFERIYRSQE
jgi:Response regulator containing a CheY-like receiver domain and an HD-GYP domain